MPIMSYISRSWNIAPSHRSVIVGDARVGAVDAGADAEPGGMLPAEQVVDDLEVLADAVVDGRLIGEHEEGEVRVVAQRAQHLDGRGRRRR